MLLAAALLGALGAAVLTSTASGAPSITANPANPTTTTGVYFTVTTGGGNRDFASVEVRCSDAGNVVYATVLTVSVPPKGAGTSQTIYPPASSCVAELQKRMQIGKPHVLATTSFTVSP
jgi:hypothetical protein